MPGTEVRVRRVGCGVLLEPIDTPFDVTGTRDGDRLDVLATLIDAYEAEHYPIDPPDPIEAIKFRMEQQGSRAGTWRSSSGRGPA
jgi:antitoxin component HigA of HigAB toxin-antitoxin module